MSKRSYTKADKIHALKVVELCEGNVSAASRETGIPRKTLEAWIKEAGEIKLAEDSPLAEGLTDKQVKYAQGRISGLNQTEAARFAGYSGDDNVLARRGHELARNSKVQALIADRAFSAGLLTTEEVIGTLAEHMRGDLTDCFNDEGYFSFETARQRKVTHLIKKIRYDQYGSVSAIEFHNQQSAADKLAEILGLKQKKSENKIDAERRRKAILDKAAEFASKHHISEEAALEQLLAARPELRQWIN